MSQNITKSEIEILEKKVKENLDKIDKDFREKNACFEYNNFYFSTIDGKIIRCLKCSSVNWKFNGNGSKNAIKSKQWIKCKDCGKTSVHNPLNNKKKNIKRNVPKLEDLIKAVKDE